MACGRRCKCVCFFFLIRWMTVLCNQILHCFKLSALCIVGVLTMLCKMFWVYIHIFFFELVRRVESGCSVFEASVCFSTISYYKKKNCFGIKCKWLLHSMHYKCTTLPAPCGLIHVFEELGWILNCYWSHCVTCPWYLRHIFFCASCIDMYYVVGWPHILQGEVGFLLWWRVLYCLRTLRQ